MLIQEIIREKRDGGRHSPATLAALVSAIADGQAGDAQTAAWAMAAFLQGLDSAETGALTRAMTDSGTRLTWPATGGPVLDKHSTGGVGDKVSLILAPIVAACGGRVPMISGRGLGHTGGTIDKLESIPGYRTTLSPAALQDLVAAHGWAIAAQSAEIAPADKQLYAVRDVTATVESQPLIVASILSKKLAAGLDGLVMDVKCGNGAFMPDRAAAYALAEALTATAAAAALPTRCLITGMGSVLGRTAGNALEVREAIDLLAGAGKPCPRLWTVTMALAGEMLAASGLSPDPGAGTTAAENAVADGRAAEAFQALVAANGGPTDLIVQPDRHLPSAPVVAPVPAPRAGYVAGQDARALGQVVVALGGGRARRDDAVDPAVGLSDITPVGGAVAPDGHPLARVHARDDASAAQAVAAVQAAMTVSDMAPPAETAVLARVPSGV